MEQVGTAPSGVLVLYLVYYFVYWLAALLLARFTLSLFVHPQSLNVAWRVLVIVTDPPCADRAAHARRPVGNRATPRDDVLAGVFLLAYWLLLHQFDLAPRVRRSAMRVRWTGSGSPRRYRSAAPSASARLLSGPS